MQSFYNVRRSGDDVLLVLTDRARYISTTINGGIGYVKYILFHHVELEEFFDPWEELGKALKLHGLGSEDTIVFMTTIDLDNIVVLEDSFNGVDLAVIASVGLSNPTTIGCSEYSGETYTPSTINIAVLTNAKLRDNVLVELIKTVVEAKVKAVIDLDLRACGQQAVGTSTDALLVASTMDRDYDELFGGQVTKMGSRISRLVYSAVIEGAKKQGYLPSKDIVLRLKSRGIELDNIIDTALELFIPWNEMTRDDARRLINDELRRVLRDPNVNALIAAALRLDDDARLGLIPGLRPEDYENDPVYLVADEVLGLSLALYLNGWNGVFEYYRYDTRKPGILGKLPPFIDDIIAALIGGVTSRIYSRGL